MDVTASPLIEIFKELLKHWSLYAVALDADRLGRGERWRTVIGMYRLAPKAQSMRRPLILVEEGWSRECVMVCLKL